MNSSSIKNSWFETKAFLKHWLKAKGPHGVHSPLVYELITKVLPKRNRIFDFDIIEAERRKLLKDNSIVQVDDFGAGSRVNSSSYRKVSSIAKSALQSAKCAQAFSKIILHFQTKNILELGTSLGTTTSYFASTNSNSKIWTIEGAASIYLRATEVFSNLELKNIKAFQGTFGDILPLVLEDMKVVDFALIDGHHAYVPTMKYFNMISDRIHENSIVVLDDIHWSAEMEKAWSDISARSDVTASLDFFHFGILFFHSTREKEHFVLKLP